MSEGSSGGVTDSGDLLDELASIVGALRSAPRGSDAQLALLDAASNTLMIYTMEQLGASPDQVRRLWRAAGLDQPPSFLKSREA